MSDSDETISQTPQPPPGHCYIDDLRCLLPLQLDPRHEYRMMICAMKAMFHVWGELSDELQQDIIRDAPKHVKEMLLLLPPKSGQSGGGE